MKIARRVLNQVGVLVTKHPKRVLVAVALVSLLAGFEALTLRFDASFMGLLPPGDERVKRFKDVTESFGGTSNLLLLVDGEQSQRGAFLDELSTRIEELEAVASLDVKIDVRRLAPPPEAIALDSEALADLVGWVRAEPEIAAAFCRDPGLASTLSAMSAMAARGTASGPAAERAAALSLRLLGLTAEAAEGRTPGPGALLSAAARGGAAELPLDGDGRLVSTDGGANLAVLRLQTDISRLAIGFDAFRSIDRVTAEVAQSYPKLRWGYAGIAAYGFEDQQNVLTRLKWLSLISLGLVLLLFLWVDRSPRVALFVGICMGIGLLWTFALVGRLLGTINLTSAVFGILLFGLSVDFAVHLIVRIREEGAQTQDLNEAIRVALRRTGPGVVTGGMTTSLAFLALLVSDQPASSSLGLTTGIGLLCSLFAMVVVFPALLSLFGRQSAGVGSSLRVPRFERWVAVCARRPRLTLAITLGVTVGLGLMIPSLRLEYDIQKIATQGTKAQAIQAEIDARFEFSSDNGLCLVHSLGEAKQVAEALRRTKGIRRVESVTDFIPADPAVIASGIVALSAALHSAEASPPAQRAFDESDVQRLKMTTRVLMAMALQAVEIEAHPKLAATATAAGASAARIARALDDDRDGRAAAGLEILDQSLRFALEGAVAALLDGRARPLAARDLPPQLYDKFFDRTGRMLVYVQPEASMLDGVGARVFWEQLQRACPDGATGPPVIVVILLDEVIADMPICLLAAALAVGLLLVIDLRRVRFVCVTFLPLVVSLICAVGLMALIGRDMNVLALGALPLIFGIGVDDGVHLVHRYREEGDPVKACASVGRAILLTTITTLISFGALLLLNHVGLETLGLLVGTGVAFCFLTSVTVFPAAVVFLRIGPDGKRL